MHANRLANMLSFVRDSNAFAEKTDALHSRSGVVQIAEVQKTPAEHILGEFGSDVNAM